MYLFDVHCTGTETNILSCSNWNQIGITTCDHSLDAAVRCEGMGRRLRVYITDWPDMKCVALLLNRVIYYSKGSMEANSVANTIPTQLGPSSATLQL